MKKLFSILLVSFVAQIAFAQKKEAKKEDFVQVREKTKYSLPEKSINLELIGRGGLFSLNFDAMVSDSFAVGAGFGYVSISASSGTSSASASATFIPIYGNYYFNESNHRFYATGGADLVILSGSLSSSSYGLSQSATGTSILPVVGVGYEYRGDDWFLFRVAPYIFIGSGAVYVTGGLTFGYAF